MNIYLNINECNHWSFMSKIEKIKALYDCLESALKIGNIDDINYHISQWKLVTESIEIISLNEALIKYKH